MAYTLLKYVQLIMNSMDSDEVETYNETIESLQVANLLEQTFYEIMSRREWEFLKHNVRQLDDATTNSVTLTIPADVSHVELIRYKDYDTGYQKDVRYLPPADFIIQQQGLDTSQTNITSVTVADGVTMGVYNDRVPTYWTSFDEELITFDAYDAVNEVDGLIGASSTILATILPTWTVSDTFVPTMPKQMESLLLNEAISVCWLNVKQEGNPKAEAIARRQFTRMTFLDRKTVIDNKEPNYGRSPRRGTGLYSRR